MLRVLKYYKKDYRIPIDSLGEVIARLVKDIDFDSRPSESELALVITGLLREVDPAIDPSHVAHLPAENP
jgi:PHP family Zn ribbon phosphoesterase